MNTVSTLFKKIALIAPIVLAVAVPNAFAGETKPLVLPPPPPPAKPAALPFNAQPTNTGVYVPVNKSGNVGVEIGKLPNAKPGETGGAVSITIKTP